MNRRTQRNRPRLRFVGEVAFAVAVACVVVATFIFGRTSWGTSTAVRSGYLRFAIAVSFYIASHSVRVLRLAVLVGDPKVSLKHIGLVHFLTAAVSFITPLKLGEGYRVAEMAHLLANAGRALVIVWVERAFDFAAIGVLVLIAAVAKPSIVEAIQPIILLSLTYVIATLLLFMVLPEALRALNLFVVRKYEGDRAIRRLQVIEWFQSWVTLGPQVVTRRIALLGMLTFAVWGLELAALAVLLPATAQGVRQLLSGLPIFLAAVSSGGFSQSRTVVGDDYRIMISGTLLVLGSVAGLAYAPMRIRARRHRALVRRYEDVIPGMGH
jgi:hypothetical protein